MPGPAPAVRLVRAVFPESGDDVRTWERCAQLLAHALAVADHAEGAGTKPEAMGALLNHVAGYLWARAELILAMRLFERALAIVEAAYGSDHPSVGSDVNNLALVLQDLGDLEGARRGC